MLIWRMIIDTHCHLQGTEFEADLQSVVSNAQNAGVGQAVLIGVDQANSARAFEVQAKFPQFFAVAAGVHPNEAKGFDPAAATWITDLAQSGKIVGIGETGLDFHYDYAPRNDQEKAFQFQIETAQASDLPLIIHCREAYPETLEVLRQHYPEKTQSGAGELPDSPGGVMHCYFGSLEQAHELIARGFVLGIGGSCTFKNAKELHEVIRKIPLKHLVLETDAPYMTPVPFRGKRNESAHLRYVVSRVAELKDVAPEVVVETTTSTALRLFRNKIGGER